MHLKRTLGLPLLLPAGSGLARDLRPKLLCDITICVLLQAGLVPAQTLRRSAVS